MKTTTHEKLWLLTRWSLTIWLLTLFSATRADAQACQFQQGQNGGVRGAVISPVEFARGNVNGSKAHYVEGNSIPYRIEFTTLTANTQYRALISFDVKKQTKYALDYITGFQNLKYSSTDPAEQVNPIIGTGLEGIGGIVVNTFPIPNPTFSTLASFNTTATNSFTLLKTPAYFNPEVTTPVSPLSAAARDKGNIAIWNATINSMQYVNTINTSSSDVHATFEVIFTKANNANPVVLAWGGHIASTQTWGEGNSAHDIPGSPYHMFVETVETSDGVNTICNGNMDCQLSSNAVSILPTCSISGPTRACPETNLLTYTATLDAATYGAVNYTWLLTNGSPSAGAQLTGTLSGSTTAATMSRDVTPLAADFIPGGKFRLQLSVERDGNTAVCYLNSSEAPGDSVLINDVATTAAASPTSFSLNTTSTSDLSATTQLNGVTDNAAFTYAWVVTSPGGLNGGTLTGASTRTPQFTAVNPGTYKFRVTATQTAAPNCVDIDSVTVVVSAEQACPTVPRNPVCADTSSVTYTASAPPATDVAYIWLVNNGAVITSANGLQSVTVDPGTISFNLSLVLDYTNPSIPNDTCSYPVTVNPLPVVNTGSYGPYCIDATPVTLSGTPSGGTWSGPGVSGTTFNVQTAGVGTHQIIYNYTDANGCSAADTTNIIVNPLPVVNTGSYGPYCIDAAPVTLSGTPSGGTWSGPGVSGTTLNVQTAGVGTHQIIYNYTDANGCSAADTTSIVVNPLPVVNTGSYGPYCIDATPVTLSGSPSGGTWSGPGVSGTTFNVQTAGVGTHQIIYNYTDVNGCSAADTTNITVNPLPIVNTGTYEPVCDYETTVALSGTPSGGTWSGPGVTGTTFNVQTAGIGTHQLIYSYTDANGCTTKDTTELVVEDCGDDDFCTYTQGYFGSKNGKACDGDSLYQNPVSLIRSLLLPGNIILGAGTRTITITVNDSVRVNMVMPGGSAPRALTHTGNISMSQLGAYNYLNRQGRLNNVFLSQTLALSLNLRINPTLLHFALDSGYLVTQKLANCGDTTTTLSCEMDSAAIESWPMNDQVVGYLDANGGATVENLLNLANKLLGQVLMPGTSGAGGTTVPSYSAVSGMVSAINEAFDECRVFLLYNPTKMVCPELGVPQLYVDVPEEPVRSAIRVNAFPNPYGMLIQFSLTATIGGQAELSLFDLSGRQLAQLYQGNWNAGDWRLINYAIKPGQAVPMIYRFRVGKEIVTGKLMPGN